MTKSLRALAALLSYPDDALLAALPEIKAFAPKGALRLVEELSATDLYALQERYVALFDRSRALSLHLFEHVHGESRSRGQAMVDLQAMYAARGLRVAGHELPDYLPAFLEYASLLESGAAAALLREAAHVLRALGERLAERGSPYAGVFAALLELAGEPGLARKARARVEAAEDLAALERDWMDPQVTFGGPQPVRLYRNGVPA
jgi:nitrate reductase delta subunit